MTSWYQVTSEEGGKLQPLASPAALALYLISNPYIPLAVHPETLPHPIYSRLPPAPPPHPPSSAARFGFAGWKAS